MQIFPDLVLTSADRGRKLMGTVEVETAESVNHLEAMAQWAHLGRARAPFHLYVPLGSVDIARRLAAENQVNVTEIWSFHTIGDQTRFTLVQRTPEDTRRSSEPRGVVVFCSSRAAQACGSTAAAAAAPAAGEERAASHAAASREEGSWRSSVPPRLAPAAAARPYPSPGLPPSPKPHPSRSPRVSPSSRQSPSPRPPPGPRPLPGR